MDLLEEEQGQGRVEFGGVLHHGTHEEDGPVTRLAAAGITTLALLLGGRRLAVNPDAERRWRVEGFFELSLNATTPRATTGTGVLSSVVAGTCFDGSPTRYHSLEIPVEIDRIAA